MGGMHGFGCIPYATDEPAFHHAWERRVWGLCQAASYPDWANLDNGRHALELMPPDLYLSYSYFERWLYGLTTTLLAGELVTLDEVKNGRSAPGSALRTMRQDPVRWIHTRRRSTGARSMHHRASRSGTR